MQLPLDRAMGAIKRKLQEIKHLQNFPARHVRGPRPEILLDAWPEETCLV
ncbi:hypothetical protein AB4037_16420 [Labrys sp. KB_33_2]